MKLKYSCLLFISLFAISCTKKEISNQIIIFTYDTPTYSIVESNYGGNYVNTYFFDVDNAITIKSSSNNGSSTDILKKSKGTDFQSIFTIPEINGGMLTMVDNNTGYLTAGGMNNDVYKTTNGGISWTKIYTAVFYVTSLVAPDDNTIYLTSESTIYKSADGGVTWNIVLPQNFQHTPNFLYFLNSTTGFVAQDNGRVMKTVDGGQTWNLYQLPTSENVSSLFFTDSNNGYGTAGGENYLFNTTNGGQTWTRLSENDIINSGQLYFYPDGRGIVIVRGEYVLYTRDFGKTTKLFLNMTGANSSANINAVNDTTLMVSTNSSIYKINFTKK